LTSKFERSKFCKEKADIIEFEWYSRWIDS
jgi:hypothetical protein